MILKCAIVDDEPLALELLASYVKKIPFLELTGKYGNAIESMNGLNDNPVDLIYLDIQMPELNGLEFARMLPERTRVVFTTAFDQYAIDGYRVNALDYLLKPISYVDFLAAANKALQWFNLIDGQTPADEVKSIFVKSDYKLLQIDLDRIKYVEGLKDYVKIYTDDSPRPILSLMNMKAMEQMLPESRFIRVHRSFIVQKGKIREIDRNRIVFGDVYIPIGDSYKQAFQDFLKSRS
ncbi:MAG: LytTR family DNA-binding domain-containing protein [Sodaliphilus sp.]|nr:LytTR family DNA-binding domain-containing protein [Sodaliphilus sp.]